MTRARPAAASGSCPSITGLMWPLMHERKGENQSEVALPGAHSRCGGRVIRRWEVVESVLDNWTRAPHLCIS
jgi:hypothetical protein